MATARLRWRDPQSRRVIELSQEITAGETAAELSATDPYFRQAASSSPHCAQKDFRSSAANWMRC